MPTPISCNICKADLRGDPIPVEFRPLYGRGAAFYSLIAPIFLTKAHGEALIGYRCPVCEGINSKDTADPLHKGS